MTTISEQLRAKFETWADDQGFPLQRTIHGEDYQDLRTQGAFEAYQAGRASLQSQKPKGNDIMLSGVIRMPFEMAMADPISRMQFYQRAQQALNELEALQHSCKETSQAQKTIAYMTRNEEGDPVMLFFDLKEARLYCNPDEEPEALVLAVSALQSRDREDALDKAKHALMIAQAHAPCPLYAEATEAIDHARRIEEDK